MPQLLPVLPDSLHPSSIRSTFPPDPLLHTTGKPSAIASINATDNPSLNEDKTKQSAHCRISCTSLRNPANCIFFSNGALSPLFSSSFSGPNPHHIINISFFHFFQCFYDSSLVLICCKFCHLYDQKSTLRYIPSSCLFLFFASCGISCGVTFTPIPGI